MPEDIFFEEAEVMVEIGGHLVYGSFHDRITDEVHGPALRDYLITKYEWDEENSYLILKGIN